MSVRLTKHHGLRNDFLVWLDGDVACGPANAVRWCNRREGIGADGLLVGVRRGVETWQMVLFNGDGSRAEMSGNGIRCFAQAIGEGRPGIYEIETDGGVRRVQVTATEDPLTIDASVDMGLIGEGLASPTWSAIGCDPHRPVLHLSLGNPHTVVGVEDVKALDLRAIGEQVPDVNLEVVEPGPEPFAITMRVHERGAGITEACGTGACASAWAATRWGMVPSTAHEVLVHMDGGDARVRLDTPEPGRVTLVGPAVLIGTVEVIT